MSRILSILDGDLEERIYELEQLMVYYRHAMSNVLGIRHCLHAGARTIKQWHADPNCDIEEEAQKVMDLGAEIHRLIVWTTSHGPDETECFGHPPLHPHQPMRYCEMPEK